MSDHDESEENLDDPDITPEMLEQLSSLRDEREIMQIDLEQQTKNLLREHAPRAALNLIHMSNSASNENIKFNASKYIVDFVRDPGNAGGEGILEGILGNLVKDAETIANGGKI